ncbi:hypothetical protein M9H77_07968 [Catharanthus roseus]|uniref:Uncharacterized protein n=1 Tax=Catharanthus roseus TaxID=4058 RepID=A0ACC0BWG2_CATRO|nr:hypothetical protein M9H77_07968 [Catharanthus roseus]
MEKPVNASSNKCLKCLSWGLSKRELESVDIRRRSSIVDENENNEDKEEVEWSSIKKRKRKSFDRSLISKCRIWYVGVRRRGLTPASPVEMSTPSTPASIPSGTSPSPVAASPIEMSTPRATFTPFRSYHT